MSDTLSPLDGRYLNQVKDLQIFFSENALIKNRILVEILYLIELVDFLKFSKLTQPEKQKLTSWVKKLSSKDLIKVKQIEAKIHHDVKAVEYFIRQNLKKLKLEKLSNWIHWGLTSEDVNNLSYGLMVQQAKDKILVPHQIKLLKQIVDLAKKYQTTVMPGRTHGQIAVPTTVGKELLVFVSRASFFLEKIINLKLGGKLNGAVGNLNAQVQIFPHKNWLKFSHDFIKKLGLEPTMLTTQIEPAYRLVYLLDLMRQLNNVWLNLATDCWFYISLDYFLQKPKGQEVGSSTMPHKINPIDFENSEGNLQLANSLLQFTANKLAISRLQRDLSDSTVKRNLGLGFGYSLIVANSLQRGLVKIVPHKQLLKTEITNHPEMLSEALQLILKVWGHEQAYEQLKKQTRGKKVTWSQLICLLKPEQQKVLQNWKAENYFGLADKLVNLEIRRINKILRRRK